MAFSRTHLQRLRNVWTTTPVYFVTICTYERRPLLATPAVAQILLSEWTTARERHGWYIGRYVIMPDHVHFFTTGERADVCLSDFIGHWKEWTAKRACRESNIAPPLWQPRFFDHLLRSEESRAEKWEYVRRNPVRAGLVTEPDAWPYQGVIDFE